MISAWLLSLLSPFEEILLLGSGAAAMKIMAFAGIGWTSAYVLHGTEGITVKRAFLYGALAWFLYGVWKSETSKQVQ